MQKYKFYCDYEENIGWADTLPLREILEILYISNLITGIHRNFLFSPACGVIHRSRYLLDL
jgi:hypothetical protein